MLNWRLIRGGKRTYKWEYEMKNNDLQNIAVLIGVFLAGSFFILYNALFGPQIHRNTLIVITAICWLIGGIVLKVVWEVKKKETYYNKVKDISKGELVVVPSSKHQYDEKLLERAGLTKKSPPIYEGGPNLTYFSKGVKGLDVEVLLWSEPLGGGVLFVEKAEIVLYLPEDMIIIKTDKKVANAIIKVLKRYDYVLNQEKMTITNTITIPPAITIPQILKEIVALRKFLVTTVRPALK